MKNCLQCQKELTHVPGRKEKSFCNVNCRNKYFYAKRKELLEKAAEAIKNISAGVLTEPVTKVAVLGKSGKIKTIKLSKPITPNKQNAILSDIEDQIESSGLSSEAAKAAMDMVILGQAITHTDSKGKTTRIDPVDDKAEIIRQIAAIEDEKCPKERDTLLGRKSWRIDQQKRINELKKQLQS